MKKGQKHSKETIEKMKNHKRSKDSILKQSNTRKRLFNKNLL